MILCDIFNNTNATLALFYHLSFIENLGRLSVNSAVKSRWTLAGVAEKAGVAMVRNPSWKFHQIWGAQIRSNQNDGMSLLTGPLGALISFKSLF